MQFWGRNMRTLYIWVNTETVDDPELGDAVPKYERGRQIRVAMYPLERASEQALQGILPTDRWTGITLDKSLRTGDRLGTATEPTLKVVSTMPYDTGLTLTLESLDPESVV